MVLATAGSMDSPLPGVNLANFLLPYPWEPPPCPYRGNSIIRNRHPVGPYRGPMSRVLGGSQGGGRFLMGEVPLCGIGYRRVYG